MNRPRPFTLIGFCIALGWIVTWVSRSMLDRVLSMEDVLYNQCALLVGQPFRFGADTLFIAPHYNRILFPLLFCNLQQWTILDPTNWYYLLRLLFVSGSFGVVWWVAHTLSANGKRATEICVFLALVLVLTFNHNVEQPHDVLDIAAFALATLFTLRHQWRAVLLLTVLCAVHRESAAFMGILWWGYHYRHRMAWLEGGLIILSNYALVLAIRVLVAGSAALQGTQWLSLVSPLPFFRELFVDNDVLLGVAGIVLLATWLSLTSNYIPRRLVAVSLAIAGVSLIFGLFYELRIFIPSITILAVAGAYPPALEGEREPPPPTMREASLRTGEG